MNYILNKFNTFLKYAVIILTTVAFTLLISANLDKNQYGYITRIIEKYYVDEVDPEVVANGARAGMLSALGDPHTLLIDSEYGFDTYENMVTGEYVGIGVSIAVTTDKYCQIAEVFENSSAFNEGLKVYDKIVKVDGKDVKGLSTTEVSNLIKGEENTTVNVTVLRQDTEKEFTLTRKHISTKTVSAKVLNDNIGYIKISQFDIDTNEELKDALKTVKSTKGLIIDLRNNPGGIMNVAVDCIDLFLEKESLIVTAKYKEGETEYKAENDMEYKEPLVVLVNKDSASASEIFSGAIKDNERGIIVGETTHGKGSIQTSFKLNNNQGLSITIGRFYSPNGALIDKKGVTPQLEVIQSPESSEDTVLLEALKQF